MTNQITPPPELVEQWLSEHYGAVSVEPGTATSHIARQAAQWGADQELEACVAWLDDTDCEDPQEASLRLRWHRRPKPPSLKEQALEAAQRFYAKGHEGYTEEDIKDDFDTIRRALEALDD